MVARVLLGALVAILALSQSGCGEPTSVDWSGRQTSASAEASSIGPRSDHSLIPPRPYLYLPLERSEYDDGRFSGPVAPSELDDLKRSETAARATYRVDAIADTTISTKYKEPSATTDELGRSERIRAGRSDSVAELAVLRFDAAEVIRHV